MKSVLSFPAPVNGLIRSEGFHTQEPAYAGELGNPNGLLRRGC
jgi:hypothetical protein